MSELWFTPAHELAGHIRSGALSPVELTEAYLDHIEETNVDGEPVPNLLAVAAFTYPFNLSGHPAATVRPGLSDAGLSAALQIVGPRHREHLVLQASYAYECERPWNHLWPRQIPPLAGE